MKKVVVFCPNLIGDTVMATPAIRALRQGYPEATLIGVVKAHVAPTLEGTSWFDEIIPFALKSPDRSLGMGQVLKRLKQERADLAVLFPNSFRSALMATRAGIQKRIGYSRGGRGFLLTDRLDVAKDAAGKPLIVPAVEYYLAIIRRLGLRVDSLRLELATTPTDESAADQAWSQLRLDPDRPVVVMNTGGAFGPAKSWPNPYFSEVARRLALELNVQVLVVCGPGERDSARAIVTEASHPSVVSLADLSLSIGLTKACVKRAALMITTDSGPRHFAAAFGVPVISLFGPTHMAWTRTNHPQAVHLAHPVPCGPCQKPTCALGHHQCMTQLSPDTVYDVARRMLSRENSARSPHFLRIVRADPSDAPLAEG